jgi:hypothetical protein
MLFASCARSYGIQKCAKVQVREDTNAPVHNKSEMDSYISANLYDKYDMYSPGMDLYICANLYDKYDMYNPEMDLYIS